MIDIDAVRLCAAIYDPETPWASLWKGTDPDGIYAAVSANYLVFRGSVTGADWARDFRANPIMHPKLGGVEFGFMEGIDEFANKVVPSLGDNPIVCGHSLGAARAVLFGALLAANGKPPAAIVAFGCPKPGFLRLSEILAPVSIRSYKNRFDPVTDVPLTFYPDLPYIQPRAQIQLDVKPAPDDFGFFADHHVNLYVEGVEQCNGEKAQ